MSPSRSRMMLCILTLAAVFAGCTQQKADMSAMMHPPRPPELDMLDSWVGKWEDVGEMTTCEHKVIKTNGTHDIAWDLDKRILVERMDADMGDMGKMTGMAIYSYDPHEKEFKYRFYANNGEVTRGELEFNKKTGGWKLEAKSKNPATGIKTIGLGKFTMPDKNTIEWTWTEWDSLKIVKLMDGHGTVKRK